MTSNQHPIGTSFTAASTAEDVIAGIDLAGKNAIVTGGHNGLGRETTRVLRAAGAAVTVASRDPERAAAALEGIDDVEIARLDLMDPASIDTFVEAYLASGRPLHILINGAGIMAGPLVRDARGYEANFATNHLGHFQLTTGLLPALQAAHGARVVNVSSGAQRGSGIRFDDPNFVTGGYNGQLAYAQSKAANVLFAVELDRRWAADGIRGFALHPGIILGTSLGPARAVGQQAATFSDDEHRRMGLVDAEGRPIIDPARGLKTVEQGASTIVFAATSPQLDGIGGVYLKDNDVSPIDSAPLSSLFDGPPSTDVAPHSIDPIAAQKLWELSEQLLAA